MAFPSSISRAAEVSGEWIDACKKIAGLVPVETKLIPGHGELSTIEDVRSFTKIMEDTLNLVADQVKQGKTADQIKQATVLAAYSKYSGSFITTDKWVDTIYQELKGQ